MKKLLYSVVLFFVVCEVYGQVKKVDILYTNTKDGTVLMFPSTTRNIVAYPGSSEYVAAVKGGSTVFLKAVVEDAKPCRLWIRYDDNDFRTMLAYKSFLTEDEMYLNLTKVEDVSKLSNDSIGITEKSESVEVQIMKQHLEQFPIKKKDRYNSNADVREGLILKLSDLMQDDRYYFVKLGVFNQSKSDYEVASVDWFYRNRSDDRDHHQEFDQAHVGNTVVAVGKGENIIYAVPKYNISSRWYLEITVSEKNGARKRTVKAEYGKLEDAERFEVSGSGKSK